MSVHYEYIRNLGAVDGDGGSRIIRATDIGCNDNSLITHPCPGCYHTYKFNHLRKHYWNQFFSSHYLPTISIRILSASSHSTHPNNKSH